MKRLKLLLLFLLPLTACSTNLTNVDENGYRTIEEDACSQSGMRQPNAKVDVGFGEREYWAYTNDYGQVVRVEAKEIILQNDETEPVNKDGRYCDDEAKVPGTERADLSCSHLIADSLGGTANAYNITPQDSTLNSHGDQAYMEKVIRNALHNGGMCTDFVAEITYPNTTTQIPSHYKYTYKLNGNVIIDEFDNVSPDNVPIKNEFNADAQYVLNTNSKKIHRADCDAVNDMSEHNKASFDGDINELLNDGYTPCKVCNPQ